MPEEIPPVNPPNTPPPTPSADDESKRFGTYLTNFFNSDEGKKLLPTASSTPSDDSNMEARFEAFLERKRKAEGDNAERDNLKNAVNSLTEDMKALQKRAKRPFSLFGF